MIPESINWQGSRKLHYDEIKQQAEEYYNEKLKMRTFF